MPGGTNSTLLRPILHVDMDSFYASIEQRDRPELKGKPVVIGSPPNQRGVVSTASYEARIFGIHSAMPSRTAGKLCPHAVFLPVNMDHYREVSREVMAIWESYTPLVEQLSIDEAFLDLSGTGLIWSDPVALARDLKEKISEELDLTASVGLAPNKFLAKLASELEKPDDMTVVPSTADALRSFLAPMEVSKIWGVGPAGVSRPRQFGLRTLGDVQQVEASTMCLWFGETFGNRVWRLAQGIDDRHVETKRFIQSISAEHTYAKDCSESNTVRSTLIALAEKVGWRLRRAGLLAHKGQLKLRYEDFKTVTRQQTFPCSTHADLDLLHCALQLYDRMRVHRPIRLIGFGVSLCRENVTIRDSIQPLLFEDEDMTKSSKSSDALDQAIDCIRDKFGRNALKRGKLNLRKD